MSAATLLVCAALLLPPGGVGGEPPVPAAREEPAPPPGASEAGLWQLLSPRRGGSPLDEATLARRIAGLGAAAAAPALRIYLGRSEEPEWGYEVDPRAIDARARVLLAALERLPRDAVLAGIDRALAEDADVDRRLDLARILARLGGAEALQRIVAVAAELDPIQWQRTFVQVPLQDGLARVVAREPRLALTLARALRERDPALAAILARGLAQAGAVDAAADLAAALGRDATLDLCLAGALAELGERAAGSLPDSALEALRRLLSSSDPALVQAGAAALSRLGDAESAARLAQLLDEQDPGVSRAALAALRTLTGQSLPCERAPWEAWLEREQQWTEERLPELERACAEADPARLAEAVEELQRHPMHRHRAARSLCAALDSRDAAVVELACAALPSFRSLSAAPALRALAEEGEPELRAAAAAALSALCGARKPELERAPEPAPAR